MAFFCDHYWEQIPGLYHTCQDCGEIRWPPTDFEVAQLIRRKLTSGNPVPVERCSITRKEYAELGLVYKPGVRNE